MSRDAAIARFLASHGFGAARAVPLAQDASFRRYLRLIGGPRPAVLMDAPPPEDVRPFLRVAAHLAGLDLSPPAIIAADAEAGLVLEEDLGDALFATLLDRMPVADPLRPEGLALFDAAIDTLVRLQQAAPPAGLPAWDPQAMAAATLDPLFEWWWPAAFGSPAPEHARADVAAGLAATLAALKDGPIGFVHRDFFAGNLIWLPERPAHRRVGLLDFQSAALGHPAYDLVSLVQDARRDLPASLTDHAIARLLVARPDLDPDAFRTAFAACAAQRHLRVATQWIRLAQRDHRPHYLVHAPRTWKLLATALRHPAAAPLVTVLDRWIPAAMRGNPGERRRGGGAQPRNAMVLAAGLGTRMRPLTAETAKPLLKLGGRSLLDHALDRLAAVGVKSVVVNAFWQADRVVAAVAERAEPRVAVLREDRLLETGGGVRAALDRLGEAPFFVVNGDAFWLDGPRPALARLAEAFVPDEVDGVLLVHRTYQVQAEVGMGDFVVDPWGGLRRRREREVAPYIYAGVQMITPSLLADLPDGPFSMNLAWDRALAAGRLRAVVHDGLWFHLSTPSDLDEAELVLHERRTGETR